MDKRQMRQYTVPAYLLMSPERHLPGRKSHKQDAVRFQKACQTKQQAVLVCNMLQDIVTEDDVKTML